MLNYQLIKTVKKLKSLIFECVKTISNLNLFSIHHNFDFRGALGIQDLTLKSGSAQKSTVLLYYLSVMVSRTVTLKLRETLKLMDLKSELWCTLNSTLNLTGVALPWVQSVVVISPTVYLGKS